MVFINGMSAPFIQVTKPKIKKSAAIIINGTNVDVVDVADDADDVDISDKLEVLITI
jgi:hypothetical protein